MAEGCIINNRPVIHLKRITTEKYKTEAEKFVPLFSECEHQVFEGWSCVDNRCIALPLEQKHVEEKVVIDGMLSELKCTNCGGTDIYVFGTPESDNALAQIFLTIVFGDLDAAAFK